jgi:hypothetical protein
MENQNPGAQYWAALWPTAFGAWHSPTTKTARVLARRGRVRGGVVALSLATLWWRADDKVWPGSTSGAPGWHRARWWSVGLTVDDRRWWDGEAVWSGSISLVATCSGGRRRPWGAPIGWGVRGDETGPAEEDGYDLKCELIAEGEIGGSGFSFRLRQWCSGDRLWTRGKGGGVGARDACGWEKKRKRDRRERQWPEKGHHATGEEGGGRAWPDSSGGRLAPALEWWARVGGSRHSHVARPAGGRGAEWLPSGLSTTVPGGTGQTV